MGAEDTYLTQQCLAVGQRLLARARELATGQEPLLYWYWRAYQESHEQRRDFGVAELYARDFARYRFAYAIPTLDAVTTIARYSPIVEIGAGTGYWAWLLAKQGANVIAYDHAVKDRQRPEDGHYCDVQHPYVPVRAGGPEVVARHPDRTLLLCWPPYASPMAAQALAAYTGQHLIYIGEGQGGCTGDDLFHHLIAQRFAPVDQLALPNWEGMHDDLYVYRRK